MDKGVNTSSFIPKRPVGQVTIAPRRQHTSMRLFAWFGWLFFILSIATIGGVYFYYTEAVQKSLVLTTEIQQKQNSLDRQGINTLSQFETKINTSKTLLKQHTAFSKLFTFLEANTVRSLKIADFSIKGVPGEPYTLTLNGEAYNYAAVALQSELFKANTNFSDTDYPEIALSKDNGDVIFTMETVIAPSFITYTGDPSEQLSFNTLTE